ncbi:MAG: hypothetical protein ACYC6M_04920 [Terriglobales bacterium]
MRLIYCQDGREIQIGERVPLFGSDYFAVRQVKPGWFWSDVTIHTSIRGSTSYRVMRLPIRYWSPGSLFDPVIVIPD